MKQYIVITPCKNEEDNLPELVQSLIKQSITPALWTIVDDGSIDKTPEIINEIKKEYKWIQSICLEESPRDLTIHISKIVKIGFDFAMNYCNEHNINYDFIVFLDSDMIICDNEFIEKLITEFKNDEHLGIASGDIQIKDISGNLVGGKGRSNSISGGEMMCRRECVEDFAGVPLTYAWDSVMRAKAIIKGWKTKRFHEIKIIQSRKTSSAEGLKKGFYIRGTSDYYLNYNPAVVIGKAMGYCLKKPYYIGIAYFFGYFSSFMLRKEQINDGSIKRYFYWDKTLDILKYYIKIFKPWRASKR